MAKNDSNILVIGALAIGGFFLYTKLSAAKPNTSVLSDAENIKLTYLEDWAGGNDQLNAMVVGVAAEGPTSIDQLYAIAVADAANQGMTAAQTTFWNNLISKYA